MYYTGAAVRQSKHSSTSHSSSSSKWESVSVNAWLWSCCITHTWQIRQPSSAQLSFDWLLSVFSVSKKRLKQQHAQCWKEQWKRSKQTHCCSLHLRSLSGSFVVAPFCCWHKPPADLLCLCHHHHHHYYSTKYCTLNRLLYNSGTIQALSITIRGLSTPP